MMIEHDFSYIANDEEHRCDKCRMELAEYMCRRCDVQVCDFCSDDIEDEPCEA